jgi:hypothetical protein
MAVQIAATAEKSQGWPYKNISYISQLADIDSVRKGMVPANGSGTAFIGRFHGFKQDSACSRAGDP